jgi:RNase P/RNase MRP subunit p30
MHFGPMDVLAVLSLDFENALTADDVETAVSGIERQIKREYPVVRRIFVEAQSREGHRRAQEEVAQREA